MDVSSSVPHNPETDWRRHHNEETDLIDHDILIVIFASEDSRPVERLSVGLYLSVLHELDNVTVDVDNNRLGTSYTSAATRYVLYSYAPSV